VVSWTYSLIQELVGIVKFRAGGGEGQEVFTVEERDFGYLRYRRRLDGRRMT
jgi:hypothetical protein